MTKRRTITFYLKIYIHCYLPYTYVSRNIFIIKSAKIQNQLSSTINYQLAFALKGPKLFLGQKTTLLEIFLICNGSQTQFFKLGRE